MKIDCVETVHLALLSIRENVSQCLHWVSHASIITLLSKSQSTPVLGTVLEFSVLYLVGKEPLCKQLTGRLPIDFLYAK